MRTTLSCPYLVASGTAAVWLAALALGCGARGDPLPPLRSIPPAIPELRTDQVGIEAILSFAPPPGRFVFGNAEVEVESVELLMLAERYPAISPEMLAVALDQERVTRLRDAREATGRVRDDGRRRRIQEQLRVASERALAAGEEPPTLESLGLLPETTEEEEEPGEARTAEELLLRKVPRNVLQEWREADLLPHMVLDAARRLEAAVDLLWDELGLPTAIVDLRQPPVMPEPVELVAAATRVARGLAYEGSLDVVTFLERASVVASFAYADLATEIVDGRMVIGRLVGIPSPGPIRTRYYFAVRVASGGKYEGGINVVAALAPIAVPVAPSETSAAVSPSGVTLHWLPPGGDLWGELLAPEQLRYNVYRRRADETRFPSQPLNDEPLETTTFTDTAMGWGDSYVYLVRAQNAPVAARQAEAAIAQDDPGTARSPRKEGAGDESTEVDVVDTFPPESIGGLEATRAANRVTLRWTSPLVSTVAGFRVYRHQAPVVSILAPDPPASSAEPADAAAEAALQDADPDADLCPALPDLSILAASSEEPEASPDSTPDTEGEGTRQPGGRWRQLNSLVGAGWDPLTPTLITAQLYIDPVAARAASWLYLVSAVDEVGNEGPLACVEVRAEQEP